MASNDRLSLLLLPCRTNIRVPGVGSSWNLLLNKCKKDELLVFLLEPLNKPDCHV